MNILTEALRLLAQPPGDLVYFLVTLFALQQAFLQALLGRRAGKTALQAQRWAWATGGLLLGRGVLIVLGLLGTTQLITPALVIPPLEQFLELSGILLVLWAMLGARAARWQTWVLLVFLGLAGAYYIYCAATWPAWEAAYHTYSTLSLARTGEFAAVTLLFVGFLSLLLRPPEWEWAAGVFIFWLAGHLAQLGWPNTEIHFAVWERLAALVVFPLLALLVQRQLAHSEPGAAFAMTALDAGLLEETLHGVEAARELEPALIMASSRLAKLLNAEVCAVALTVEKEPLQLRVVAIHPPTGLLEPPLINLPAFPLLADVWHTQTPRIIQGNVEGLGALYQRLGLAGKGPLLALPMMHGTTHVGMLLLGNPDSGKRWESSQIEPHRLVTTLLAATLARTRQQGGDSFLGKLRERDVDEEKQRLSQALADAQTQITTLEDRSLALQDQLQARDREIASLSRELGNRPAQASETEVSFWQTEVQELIRDRDVLLEDRTRMGEQMAKMKEEMDLLEDERLQLQQRLKALETGKATGVQRPSVPTTVGMLVADQDGTITMVDPLARQILHLPSLGNLLGTPINGAYPDAEWTQMVDALLSNNPKAPRRAHLSLTNSEGQRAIEADLVALIGNDGQRDGLAITVRTEENPAERQEAIVGLVNEFRTPMTAMTGYTDLLLGEQPGILTEMQRQFLERVRANVEHLGQLLNDLLQIASPDAQQVELAPQPIDLIGIIEEAVTGLSARFSERRLELRMDLPPGLDPVRADRDSLYQIMVRLLSNAAQCSKEGTDVRIKVVQESAEGKSGKKGDIIRIAINDTGGGIAPEDMPKVFRRFYRAGQPLIAGMGETGIGMAVAKALVESNGGRIWVDSVPGEGSIFSFILPVYRESKSKVKS